MNAGKNVEISYLIIENKNINSKEQVVIINIKFDRQYLMCQIPPHKYKNFCKK